MCGWNSHPLEVVSRWRDSQLQVSENLSYQMKRAYTDSSRLSGSRVVHFEAVDWCICFTRKIQHGGDWERSRPQGPKNVSNFLMTVRPFSWACGNKTEMLLILKKLFSVWLFVRKSYLWPSKEMSTILHEVNLRLKPVSATGATSRGAGPACVCVPLWRRVDVFLK